MRRRDHGSEGSRSAAAVRPTAHRKALILRDLGRTPGEPAVFSLPSPLMPTGAIAGAILLAILLRPVLQRPAPGAMMIALAVGIAFAFFVLLPRRLVVGEDGLLISWIGTRFIPYVDIAQVTALEGFSVRHPCISIALRSGGLVDLGTSVFRERWAERDALLTLIRTATEDFKSQRQEGPPEALARRNRSHLEWARSLRSLGSGANLDPRTPPVPPEKLLRIAESPVAPLPARAAAFVALNASEDDEIRKRLRTAAELTAAPDAKAALGGVLLSEDEADIAEALEYAEARQARR